MEIADCQRCKILSGPTDGPVLVTSCTDCTFSVACQQFQAKGCTNCDFALSSATAPTLSQSTDIRFKCWNVRYPGLSEQFVAANLDPNTNQWNKVYDASAGADDSAPHYTVINEPSEPWEVTDTMNEESPQVAATTTATTAANAQEDLQQQEIDQQNLFTLENGSSDKDPMANGNDAYVHTESGRPGNKSEEKARSALQERLSQQSKEEQEKKAAAQRQAAAFLEKFYEKRNKERDARISAGREELNRRGSGETGPEGANIWERAISMIDFNAARGADLTRFKSVLFASKEKNAA